MNSIDIRNSEMPQKMMQPMDRDMYGVAPMPATSSLPMQKNFMAPAAVSMSMPQIPMGMQAMPMQMQSSMNDSFPANTQMANMQGPMQPINSQQMNTQQMNTSHANSQQVNAQQMQMQMRQQLHQQMQMQMQQQLQVKMQQHMQQQRLDMPGVHTPSSMEQGQQQNQQQNQQQILQQNQQQQNQQQNQQQQNQQQQPMFLMYGGGQMPLSMHMPARQTIPMNQPSMLTWDSTSGQSSDNSVVNGNSLSGMMSGNMMNGRMMNGNMMSSNMMSGNMMSGNMMSGNMMSGNMMNGSVMNGNMMNGNMMNGNTMSGNTMSDNTMSGNTMSGNMMNGNMMPSNMMPSNMMPSNMMNGNMMNGNMMNGNMMNGNMMNGNMMCSYASGPMDFCGGSMMFSPANQQFRGMEFAMERKRVRTACVSCHERKLRCIMQPNGKCQHCTNKQRPCEPREEMKRGRPRTVRPAEAKGTVDASASTPAASNKVSTEVQCEPCDAKQPPSPTSTEPLSTEPLATEPHTEQPVKADALQQAGTGNEDDANDHAAADAADGAHTAMGTKQ